MSTYTHDADHETMLAAHRMNVTLAGIPALLELAQPHPPGVTEGSGTGEPKLPIKIGLVEATVNLKATLVSWVKLVAEERHTPITCNDSIESTSAWLMHHTQWLAAHPAAEDAEAELYAATRDVERQVDRASDERVFVTTYKGLALYARPGQAVVIAPDGSAFNVREERGKLTERILDEWLPEKLCSDVITHNFGLEVTAKQIRDWRRLDERRGRTLGRRQGGQWVYRPRDVIERAKSKHQRHAEKAG